MFIAALFTIAKTWKQPKCPLTDEWIEKMWYICIIQYIYTMEYYSAIKQNEIMSFTAKWMQLEIITLSEVSQKERERQIPYDITSMWNLKYGTNKPIYKTEIDSQTQRADLWLPTGGGRERDGLGVWGWQIQAITFRMDKPQGPNVQHRELY